jgi:hypothetical protein
MLLILAFTGFPSFIYLSFQKCDGMVELCESARRGLAGALHEVGKDMRLRMGGVRRTAG